jgi:hypothetical protein
MNKLQMLEYARLIDKAFVISMDLKFPNRCRPRKKKRYAALLAKIKQRAEEVYAE